MFEDCAPYGSVSFDVMDERFGGLDFDEIRQVLWKKSQEDGDVALEYFLRRIGILMARHDEATRRIRDCIKEKPELKNESGHHILCSWNDDHTFCECNHPNFDEGAFDMETFQHLMEDISDIAHLKGDL